MRVFNVMKTAYSILLLVFICLLATCKSTVYQDDSVSSNPVVAVYYYVWYGGNGRHWGDSNYTPIRYGDIPVIGYYSSLNKSVIEWQLGLIEDAGIDVLFVSWWGPGSYEDNATQLLFRVVKEKGYSVRAALLVEPYLYNAPPEWYNETFWNNTLNYIKTNYIDPYNDIYLHLHGKPLVLAFNPIGMKYDPRSDFPQYAIRIVGNNIDNTGYQDWDLWPDYLAPWITLKHVELRIRRDGYVVLTPRFDDRLFCVKGVESNCSQRLIDPSYVLQAYREQWEWVLEHRSQVRIIAIYSWNEYHERSMVEPHYDATAGIPGYTPYTIYNVTKYYVHALKTGETLLPPRSNIVSDTIKILVFITAMGATAYYLFELRYRKHLLGGLVGEVKRMYSEVKNILLRLKRIVRGRR